MTADLHSRSQYLSLALFSQTVIRALLEYLKNRDLAAVPDTLNEALRSLENVKNGELPSLTRRQAALFSSYEHLRTLQEVWSDADRNSAISELRRLLTQPPSTPESVDAARTVIELFKRLGNQARWNFEQPSSISPKSIRELCQVQ